MHPYVFLLFRLALGGLWVAAGAGKLAAGETRRGAVAGFGLLPKPVTGAVSAALPWVELALGLLLLAGLGTRPAAAASVGLLLLFSAAILFNLARGRRVECHCFGQMGHAPISWWSLARNAGLLGVALALDLFSCDYLSIDGWRGAALRPTDPPPVGFVPVLLLALSGVALWALAASAWAVAKAVGNAEGGPALGLPERRYLHGWLAPPTAEAAPGPDAAGRNGR